MQHRIKRYLRANSESPKSQLLMWIGVLDTLFFFVCFSEEPSGVADDVNNDNGNGNNEGVRSQETGEGEGTGGGRQTDRQTETERKEKRILGT